MGRWRAVCVLGFLAGGCSLELGRGFGPGPSARGDDLEEEAAERDPASAAPALPAFSALTWNLEWFQHPEHGPTDERRQFDGALAVLAQTGASLVALQEISDPQRFAELLARLPDYAGVLTAFEWPQQIALLYRTAQFEWLATDSLRGLPDAGRAPLSVALRERAGGAELTVIVLHAKAGGRDSDWTARAGLAYGLAERLSERPAQRALIVLGDFNDRLSGSIIAGRPSPYAEWLADPSYAAPTAALEAGAEASTAWGQTIDHIVVGAELAALLQPDAADVLRDELLLGQPALLQEVSDHLPVIVRFSR